MLLHQKHNLKNFLVQDLRCEEIRFVSETQTEPDRRHSQQTSLFSFGSFKAHSDNWAALPKVITSYPDDNSHDSGSGTRVYARNQAAAMKRNCRVWVVKKEKGKNLCYQLHSYNYSNNNYSNFNYSNNNSSYNYNNYAAFQSDRRCLITFSHSTFFLFLSLFLEKNWSSSIFFRFMQKNFW